MMLWFVLFAFIVFATVGTAKSQRKSLKSTGAPVIILAFGVILIPILRVLGGWTIAIVVSIVLTLMGMTIMLLLKVRSAVAKYIGITALLLVVVIGGPAWIYEGLRAPTAEQYSQLEQVIRAHDISQIRDLAADQATEDLLMGLPTDAQVDASDFQGGGPVGNGFTIGYFPARIGGHDVNTYMITKTGFQFVPHWKLIKISINSLPPIKSMNIDPNWLQN